MKKINYRLLLFELLFAISLVCVHMPLMPKVINSLGRGAVIFFFFISSYFYQKTLEKEDYTYLKTIKKCLRLLLIEVVVYALYLAVMPFLVIKYTGVTPALFSEFSFTNLMDFFKVYVPNSSFLWFINALIICYLLMPFINKIKVIHNPKFVIVPIVILLLNYVYRAIANVYDLGFFSDRIVTRNFLFTGLPCFLIGIFIKEHIIEKEKFKKFPFWLLCIMCLCLLCFSILESYIHKILGIWPAEFYFSSVVLAAITYIYAIYYPDSKSGEVVEKVFSFRAPLIVYVIHRLFIYLYTLVFIKVDIQNVPVFFLSIISSLFVAFMYKVIYQIIVYIRRKHA